MKLETRQAKGVNNTRNKTYLIQLNIDRWHLNLDTAQRPENPQRKSYLVLLNNKY